MVHAVVDADAIKYAAACAGESRTINVVHKASGREKLFSNRTAFYGGPKRDGGWLAQQNAKRDSPFTIDEFEIIDVQSPEPVENVLHLTKTIFDKWLRSVQADSYKAFLGAGDSFRREVSTILEYKGNRTDLLKPVHLDVVTEYIERKYNAEVVRDLEADDWCVIECQDNPEAIMLAIDKDALGAPCKVYNPNRPDDGIINGAQFGALRRDGKNIRGYGRIFLYHQVCSGDKIDNYKANSASKVSWGDASSFKELSKCTTDYEAWQTMKAIYQKLYPEPTIVTGWRGDQIEVDWIYMLEENFQMARMLRHPEDFVKARDVLDKMGLL